MSKGICQSGIIKEMYMCYLTGWEMNHTLKCLWKRAAPKMHLMGYYHTERRGYQSVIKCGGQGELQSRVNLEFCGC